MLASTCLLSWLSDGWYQKILPWLQLHFYVRVSYAYVIFFDNIRTVPYWKVTYGRSLPVICSGFSSINTNLTVTFLRPPPAGGWEIYHSELPNSTMKTVLSKQKSTEADKGNKQTMEKIYSQPGLSELLSRARMIETPLKYSQKKWLSGAFW